VRVIFKSKYFDTSSSSNRLSVSCSEKCTTLSQSTSCNFIRNLANDFERLERNENETKPVESQLLRSVKAMSTTLLLSFQEFGYDVTNRIFTFLRFSLQFLESFIGLSSSFSSPK
jgi:hypothetical protein